MDSDRELLRKLNILEQKVSRLMAHEPGAGLTDVDATFAADLTVGGNILGSLALGCRVINTSPQNISTAVYTPLSYNTEIHDTDGCWSSANPTKLYAKHAGYYIAGGGIMFSTALTTVWRVHLDVHLNGSTYLATTQILTGVATDYFLSVTTGFFYMDVDDYVEIRVFQASGGTIAINAASTTNHRPSSGWLARIA